MKSFYLINIIIQQSSSSTSFFDGSESARYPEIVNEREHVRTGGDVVYTDLEDKLNVNYNLKFECVNPYDYHMEQKVSAYKDARRNCEHSSQYPIQKMTFHFR